MMFLAHFISTPYPDILEWSTRDINYRHWEAVELCKAMNTPPKNDG